MDETTTDVVQPEGGEQIAPQSDPSPQGTEQDSPGGESQIEVLSQEVTRLSGMVRAFQSDEDRRIPTIERELKTQGEQLKAYHERREAGLTHEQAQREQALDELVATRLGDAPVPPTQEAAPQATVAVTENLSPILKLAGLDSGDADVIEIIRANPENELAQISAITKLAETRKQVTPAKAAAVMPSGGGKAVVSEDVDSLSERLSELLDLPMQTAESEAEREEIRAKLNTLSPIQ